MYTKSKEKIGYIHILNMGVHGYAELQIFLTGKLDKLIIDVVYGGGHFHRFYKLQEKRVGFDLTRWMGHDPYLRISSWSYGCYHKTICWLWRDFLVIMKLFKLKKFIGKRTRGGVTGIWPRNSCRWHRDISARIFILV